MPQMVMLALAVVGLTLLLRSTRRRLVRSRSPGGESRCAPTDLQGEYEATRDVEAVMAELDQLSRQIHGRLDTKLARLEAVVRDADERIDRLSRLLRESGGRETIDITLEREDPTDPPSLAGVDDSPHAAVYRLADAGRSPVEIAQEVDRTTGEVELILALRKTRRPPSHPAALTTSKA